MPKILDLRNAIKDDLVEQGILAASRIVVERQGDILQSIAAITAKLGAVALTIAPATGKPVDSTSASIVQEVTVTLSLWCKPILVPASAGETPEETVFENVMTRLHHLKIDAIHDDPAIPKGMAVLQVTGWQDVADPDYLRRNITLSTVLSFAHFS